VSVTSVALQAAEPEVPHTLPAVLAMLVLALVMSVDVSDVMPFNVKVPRASYPALEGAGVGVAAILLLLLELGEGEGLEGEGLEGEGLEGEGLEGEGLEGVGLEVGLGLALAFGLGPKVVQPRSQKEEYEGHVMVPPDAYPELELGVTVPPAVGHVNSSVPAGSNVRTVM